MAANVVRRAFSFDVPGDFLSWYSSMFGGTGKGILVTPDTAMSFTAVYACVDLISSMIASLPFNVYERTKEGRELASDHDQYILLKSEPSPFHTSFTFRKALITQVLLWGNGYAEIIRHKNSGRPVAYKLIESKYCDPFEDQGELWYKDFRTGRVIPAYNMIHIPGLAYDGIKGKSVITVARDSIAMGVAATKFGARFYENGTTLSGYIKTPKRLDEQGRRNMRDGWKKNNSGIENSWEVGVLEEDAEYKQLGMPLNDAQFIESRRFQIEEVARLFGLSPDMIGHMERATFNTMEQNNMRFYQNALLPRIVAIEQEFDRKIFTDKDKRNHYVKIEVKGLMRGDLKSRALWYKTLFYLSSIKPNEIRGFEEMNPIEGGDEVYVPVNMVPVDKLDELLAKGYKIDYSKMDEAIQKAIPELNFSTNGKEQN